MSELHDGASHDGASHESDGHRVAPGPWAAAGQARQAAVVVGVVVVALILLSMLNVLGGPFAAALVDRAADPPSAVRDGGSGAAPAGSPEEVGRQLNLGSREVAPVLGAWVSARMADEAQGSVWVQVGSSASVLPDGTLVQSTVSEIVPVGTTLHLQAWADITVQAMWTPQDQVVLWVEPEPIDAANDDGSVVAGFEPGTTTYDGVQVTVGSCVGERAVDLRVTRGDAVLVERRQARPGDVWDVPQWHRLTVWGVDNAYSDDGCRVVVELAPPGA